MHPLFPTLLLLLTFTATGLAGGKPNIVFVLFDDLGYGEPGCYRPGSKLRMPRLDALAAQGLRFTDAHSASAVCTPTRYGLLTGRYPARIGQYGVLTSFNPPLIPESQDRVIAHVAAVENQPRMIAKAVQWLEQREADKPFFALLSDVPAPHARAARA